MATLGTRQLFLYWRVRAEDRGAAVAAARALQRELALRHAGLVAGLHERDEPGAPHVTLMETYGLMVAAAEPPVVADPAGIGPALEQDIRTRGDEALSSWLLGPRQCEVFDRL